MALAKSISVEEEMKKNPEFTESDIEMLREWHKKQPHLPQMSDFELILFLHSNFGRTEPTKITIDTFFTLKTHVPEFFSGWDPLRSKELREFMQVGYCFMLPSTTPEGYRVIYAKLMDYEPSHYVFSDGVKLLSMVMALSLHTEGTCPGYIMITDMEGAVFGHLARLSPMSMKKFIFFVQEAVPLRLVGAHYINTPSFMDLILNVGKPFMKKELIDMIHLHNNINTLNEKVPIDMLPNERGGKAGSMDDLWKAQVKQLEDHSEWFQKQEMRRVNEAARPGKAKNATDLFGVEGSFKKLEID